MNLAFSLLSALASSRSRSSDRCNALHQSPELRYSADMLANTSRLTSIVEAYLEDLLMATGVRVGGLDLLSGGPPCQTFSTVGNRKSMSPPPPPPRELDRQVPQVCW